jgi:two-component system phosphate regulon sensor histidine kinase PhoR
MGWLITRGLLPLLAVLVGMAIGALVGAMLDAPRWGIVVGGVLGALVGNLRDGVHGERLMAWLRGPLGGSAPRDTGFWGEMAYRIERALRQRERSIAEERERLAQFLSAIEASPNGVMMLDAVDQIEWCNGVAAMHFGLDPQRDRQQRVTNLIRSPAFVAYLQDGGFDEPVAFNSPNGQAMLSVLVRRYGQGLKLLLSQDITERERNDAMRRDFVANVSHEIRTPLTVLAGFVETLAQLPLAEAERRKVFALMEQQTQRMQSLVADLLTLAQLEGSPRPPPDRWIAVQGLVQRAVADAAALSAGRHEIVAEGGAGVELAGSENELTSALSNLLNNAVRYTPVGGRIVVRWRVGGDGGGAIEVVDDGIGIAREHLPRLTERFYRVDSSRSRDTGGTGLGLAIVKHVAQRHGGEIEVESEPGRGSTFRLAFPAARLRVVAAAALATSA